MNRTVAGMSEIQSGVWVQLIALTELLPAALDLQLRRDAGLTHFEFAVLSVLQLSGTGELTPSALAATLSATRPRLSHVLSRLEDRGLVARTRALQDGRGVQVSITAEGRRRVITATPQHVATAKALVLNGFTEEELTRLSALLKTITSRLDPDDRLRHAILGAGDPDEETGSGGRSLKT